ncbi:MAG: MerR family transcriptional regulator [Chloroflexota bacterium]|nr:MerR family transcriptional regulator [Chloroflexota bacterium]
MTLPRAHPHSVTAVESPPADAAPYRIRIGEAARRVGMSASALRLWEQQGLVRPARSSGRYRLYSEADLARLHRVRRMRQEERVNAPGIRHILAAGPVGPAGEQVIALRRLRALRRERGFSLAEASQRSGLSTSQISGIERAVIRVSVSALQRLTAAYGVTLLELFAGRERRGRLVRPKQRAVLQLAGSDVRIEQLAVGAAQLEPQLFVLKQGATSDGAYTHEGEEFLFLLSGRLSVRLGESEQYQLREGDALSFPSTLRHRWRNEASGETRLLWINTPPTF